MLGAAGAIAAVSGGGGGGGGGGDTPADTTAPSAATGLEVSKDGNFLTGKGEAGTQVTVKDAAGNVIGKGTVGTDGNFQVNLDPPKTNGEKLEVTLTDGAGNQSPASEVIAGDTTAPEAPTELAVSADGLSVTGKGEPGASVTVKDSAGNVIGTGTVAADGTFAVTPNTPQTNGQPLDVTLADAAGNQSPATNVVAGDTTAPDAPTELAVSTDGLSVTGKGEPGASVTVKDSAGNIIGSGTVATDGTFAVIPNAPQTNGQPLNVTQTDAAGNQSPSTPVTAGDTTAPDAPTVLAVNVNGGTLTGKGEPGTTATVKDAAGNVLGTGTVAADGTFAVKLDTSQTNGQPLDVTLTDGAGNESPATNVLAGDTTAPNAPTELALAADGVSFTGKGEVGSTVHVRDNNGNLLGTGTVGADGNFAVTLNPAQIAGNQTGTTLTDAALNQSLATSFLVLGGGTGGEPVIPQAPTDLEVTQDGLKLTGKGEPQALVIVKDAAGAVIGTGFVGADGTFNITFGTALSSGDRVDVTLTNATGGVSPVSSVVYTDITAPDAPTDLVVSADGMA